MAKKAVKNNKEEREDEKTVVNKQEDKEQQLFSLEELAGMFGMTPIQMSSFYLVRGINKDKKLSYEEAYNLFKDIGW